MKKIVAIGGGEIGRPGYKIETTKIDREIIRLSGKKHPQVLFLPTASNDNELYWETFKKYYGSKLGCKTEVLYLIKEKLRHTQIKNKILSADIIYVGGGNTLKMLKVWRKLKVDKLLQQAWKKGLVLSGLSAGANCWFKYCNSDSLKFKAKRNPFIRIKGLDFINLLLCPHYDKEELRRPSLHKMMKKTPGIALALDNCVAIEIIADKYRLITSKPKAKAYIVFKHKGKIVERIVTPKKELTPLSDLLAKYNI